jgi:hypothetical protein
MTKIFEGTGTASEELKGRLNDQLESIKFLCEEVLLLRKGLAKASEKIRDLELLCCNNKREAENVR